MVLFHILHLTSSSRDINYHGKGVEVFICRFCLFLDKNFLKVPKPRHLSAIRIDKTPTKSTIPKNLHFIWNILSEPHEFVNNIRGFLKKNPTTRWKYYFWTKETGMKFIKDKYEFLYPKITDVSGIFRADVLRYLVIHEYGGVYFDLDTVSVKPLDDYVDSHDCSLTSEPGEHQFYHHIIYQLHIMDDKCKHAFWCTGQMFLTKLYRNMNKTSGKVGKIPRLEPSEVFQDVYDDTMLHGALTRNCLNTSRLPPQKVEICNKWRARGMTKRKLSDKALVYHTWYHANNRKVTYSNESNVLKLITGVHVYG